MTANEQKVLGALLDAHSSYDGFCYLGFAAICEVTGMDKKIVRRACRSLKRKGFAEFGKGLWTDSGKMAGSGYCATRAALSSAQSRSSTAPPAMYTVERKP